MILALDQSYDRIGYAVVNGAGSVVAYGVEFAAGDQDLAVASLTALIWKYAPRVVSLESVYVGPNAKTAIRLAELRGRMIQEAYKVGIQVVTVDGFAIADYCNIPRNTKRKEKKIAAVKTARLVLADQGGSALADIPKISDDEADAIIMALIVYADLRL